MSWRVVQGQPSKKFCGRVWEACVSLGSGGLGGANDGTFSARRSTASNCRNLQLEASLARRQQTAQLSDRPLSKRPLTKISQNGESIACINCRLMLTNDRVAVERSRKSSRDRRSLADFNSLMKSEKKLPQARLVAGRWLVRPARELERQHHHCRCRHGRDCGRYLELQRRA